MNGVLICTVLSVGIGIGFIGGVLWERRANNNDDDDFDWGGYT